MDKTKPTSAEPKGAPQIYTNEFKQQAVARLKTSDNATALALELGVRRNQLYKWAKQLEASGPDATFKSPGRPSLGSESELDRLRRENTRLELENNILKKAGAYFVRRKP
jgi:transposase